MKTKISILFLAFSILYGCEESNSTSNSTSNPTNSSIDIPIDNQKIKDGMIKMAIFYPNGEGKTFDMDYYSGKHMPMAESLLGNSLKALSIDKGVANGTPDTPLQYLAIGYFYFESMDSFQEAMGPNQEQLKADVPNFTNIRPMIQISEVVRAD